MNCNPILRDIPESFETERLIIRTALPGDGAALNQAVLESEDRLKPWFPWAQVRPSVEDSEALMREWHANYIARKDLQVLLFRKEDQLLIGCSGLHPSNWDVPKFEIGYWIRTGFEGKGYVTETVNRITQFGFDTLGAQRLMIRCYRQNERSAAVAKRCGYLYEGTFRNFERRAIDNALVDMVYFGMTRQQYFEMKEK
jgi:RimJ/RimL family protein N-acetyltransferase